MGDYLPDGSEIYEDDLDMRSLAVNDEPMSSDHIAFRLNCRSARLATGFSDGKNRPEVDKLVDHIEEQGLGGDDWNLDYIKPVLSDAVVYRERLGSRSDGFEDTKSGSELDQVLLDALLLGEMRLKGWEQVRQLNKGYIDSSYGVGISELERRMEIVEEIYSDWQERILSE